MKKTEVLPKLIDGVVSASSLLDAFLPVENLWNIHFPFSADDSRWSGFSSERPPFRDRHDFAFRPETLSYPDVDMWEECGGTAKDGTKDKTMKDAHFRDVLAFYDDVPFEGSGIRPELVCFPVSGRASRKGWFEAYPGVFFSVRKRGNGGYSVSLDAETYGFENFTEEWSPGEVFFAVSYALAPLVAEGRAPSNGISLCLDAAAEAAKSGEILHSVVDRLSGKETSHPLLASVLFELAACGPVKMSFMGQTMNAARVWDRKDLSHVEMGKKFGHDWKWTPEMVSGASFSPSEERTRIGEFVERIVSRIEPFLGLSKPFDMSFRTGDAKYYENLFGLLHRYFPGVAETLAYSSDSFNPYAKGNFAHLKRTTCTWSTFFNGMELPAYCGYAAREKEFLDAACFSLDVAKKKGTLPPSLKSFFGVEGAFAAAKGLLFEEYFCSWKVDEYAFMDVPLGFPTEVPAKFRSRVDEVLLLMMEDKRNLEENAEWLAEFENAFSECRKEFSSDGGEGFPYGRDKYSLSRAGQKMRDIVVKAAMTCETERDEWDEVVL